MPKLVGVKAGAVRQSSKGDAKNNPPRIPPSGGTIEVIDFTNKVVASVASGSFAALSMAVLDAIRALKSLPFRAWNRAENAPVFRLVSGLKYFSFQ